MPQKIPEFFKGDVRDTCVLDRIFSRYKAEASLAEKILGWCSTQGLGGMCIDLRRWQSMNPNGFVDA